MNVVTQDIRMQATLIHAVQPVHEAQDLRAPSPLPRGVTNIHIYSYLTLVSDSVYRMSDISQKGA